MTTHRFFRNSLFATLIITALAGSAQAAEFRAFWADAWGAGFQTPAEVETLLGKPGDPNSIGEIRKNNLNAVIVQVRRRYDTCYPSGVGEPYMVMNQQLTPPNYNALQQILDAAHDTTGGKKRIEVHCWIVTFKTDKGTVYSQHHDTGNPDNYWVTRLSSRTGTESSGGNFDPGHPKVLKYISDACMDLVTRFDIDGLHYDYVRFEGNTEGFNPTSVDRYRARYGLSTDPASADEQFKQWRRDQVSCVVRQVYARIQATKPSVLHSGSFVTWNPSPTTPDRTGFIGTRPYYDVYSDWDSWISEGIIDLAVPMTYYDWAALPTDFTKWMNYEKDFTVRQPKHHMYVGPGTYHNNLDNAILELKKTRDASPNGNHAQGYSGYCYGQPYYITWGTSPVYGTWANFAPRLKTEVNPSWDDIPARTWKTAPTTGHISGTVSFGATGAWADHAQVSLSPAVRSTMYVDGNGFYSFVDLPPGQYTVTASKSGYPDATAVVDLAIGTVTGNMYVRDLQLGGTGPRFSDVQHSSITGNSASITWTTDAAATSQVQFGTDLTYGSSTVLDSNRVTSHTVNMIGLAANTRYHYRIVSTHDGGTTYSADYTFMTQAAPTVSVVQVSNVGPTSATITWLSYPAGTSYVEYGTTTGYGSSSPLDTNLMTAHSVTLTALTPSTSYHCRVTSTNDIGSNTSSDVTFTTTGPPVITSVQAGSITATGATITWTTNAAASSQVSYGLTSSYGSQTTLDSTLVTSHSVAITGLSPNTTYHYAVRSTNDGGTTQSTDYTFTTLGPPSISNVQAGSITSSGATITWTTSNPASSQVSYGQTSSYGSQTTLDSTLVISHSVALTGLSPNTTYHFAVISANAGGSTQSSDYTFTTLPPPPVISNVQAGSIADTTASISWTTDVGSSSQVQYGPTVSYGQSTTVDNTAVTAHTVNLTGLSPGTLYHYRVASTATGGTANSADYTFTTTGVAAAPVISNVAIAGYGGSSTSTITATVKVAWTTNISADSQVEYGTTTSYGSSTTLNTAMVTSHSVDVTGLGQNTSYHYRVRSSNGVGGVTYSGDSTFITPIIVDNRDAGCTIWPTSGSTVWSSGSSPGVPRVGTTYYYGSGTGDASTTTLTCTWTPNLPVAGNYDVYVYYQIGGNRSSSAPFTVFYSGGQVTSTQNQQGPSNTGGCFKIGSNLPFAAGTSGYVQVGNNSTDTKYVSADAAMFVRLLPDTEPPTAPTNVAANAVSSTSIQLTWTASTDNVGVSAYKIYRNGSYLAGTATTSYTDSNLAPNTSYTYDVTAYDAANNESGHSAQSTRVTLPAAPTGANVTWSQPTGVWTAHAGFNFTAVGGFGAGTVAKYKYAWDTSAAHTWTGSESEWSSGTLNLTADATGIWYLHLQGYNSENVANPTTADFGTFKYDGTPPTTPVVIDDGATTATLSSLHATWSASDPETDVQSYEYRIVDNTGAVIKDWTNVGTDTSVTVLDLSLQLGKSYFFKVRASNTAQAMSEVGTSDGIMAFMFDTNNDGRVNDLDFGAFFDCSAGASVEYPAGENSDCARFDTNGDSDVDADDFGVFQRCMNGDNPIDPACLN